MHRIDTPSGHGIRGVYPSSTRIETRACTERSAFRLDYPAGDETVEAISIGMKIELQAGTSALEKQVANAHGMGIAS